MGGEVGVESALGRGSKFWFTAMLEHVKAPPTENKQLSEHRNSLELLKNLTAKSPVFILLVDDNDFNQQVGSELLEAANCQVILASDGQQALDKLDQEKDRIQCILMDIQMPIMDGIAASRVIRTKPEFAKLPIIAITANAMNQDRIHCLAAGMNDFIAKPFSPDLLYSTILRWLGDIGTTDSGVKLEDAVAATPVAKEEVAIDLNVLAKLVGNSPEKIGKFAKKFVDSARSSLLEIEELQRAGDLTNLCAIGHRLKSSARTVGALQFGELCHQLEALKQDGNLADAAPLVVQLQSLFTKIEREVEDFLSPPENATAITETTPKANATGPNETSVITLKDNLHVLVLEDETVDMEIACSTLRKLGVARISNCTEGNQALAVLRTYEPDILICDLTLPGMDGISFLRLAAENSYRGGVILLSAVDRSVIKAAENLVKAYGLNLLGSLRKPVVENEMLQVLAKQLPLPVENQATSKIALLNFTELQNGLVEDRIEVLYHPKINLKTGKVVGAECLARWRHPVRGLLGPGAFVSVMETHGMIDELSKIILEKSAAQLRKWYNQGHQLKLAVNVSMDNLNQLNLPEQFESILQHVGIRPSQYILELTETRLMENLTVSLEILTRLRLKGFGLSIDDFGTGFSTMENLKQLPFTELKIDRAFVNGASFDDASKAILNSSIQLGKIFHLNLVAEGVETQQDWDFIADSGCDEVQGYFIAQAMSADQFIEWKIQWEKEAKKKHIHTSSNNY